MNPDEIKFEADLTAGELRKHGRKLRVQEKPFQLLAALLERPSEDNTWDRPRPGWVERSSPA